nr:DUF2920 family protein [Campylobacter helveticus]
MMDFTRRQIAEKFNVMAVNVLYHCFCCRVNEYDLNYSAKRVMLEGDKANLIRLCQKVGLPYENLTTMDALEFIEKSMEKEKAKGALAKDFKIDSLTYTLVPPNEEYQNYGIMAAIDHINVLKHLKIHGGGGVTYPSFMLEGVTGAIWRI